MIIIGTNNIAAAYVGATAVEKAYVGNNQIYPNTSLTLSASELSFAAAGQSLTLDIVVDENKPWTITAPNDWQVSPLSGTGPASITVTAANNTSANRRSGTLMVSSEQDAASCTLTQEAGVKVFSEVTISAFSYPDISAKGGSVAPKLNYTQAWTWNEVAGSGGNITTGATVVYTGDNVDTEGNVTAPSKGTTISNRTKITSTSVTVTLNGKSAAAQADVYQSGNYVVDLLVNSADISYPVIGAGATSATPILDIPENRYTFVFSSGSSSYESPDYKFGYISDDVKWTLGSIVNGFTAVDPETGVLTATNRGIVIGSERTSGVVVRQYTLYWNPSASYVGPGVVSKIDSKTATCTQEGNYIESLKIGGKNLSTYISPGGSFTADENSHFYTGWATVSSGSDIVTTTWVTGDWTVSQNYFSKSLSEAGVLKITAESRGTTTGVERNATLTWSLTSSSTNNKTLSTSIDLTQAANSVISYGIPTGRTLSVSDIPASGGTISSGTLGGTITQTRTFSSGASDTITNPTVTSSSYSAGVYNESLGNTVVPRTKIGTLTYSYVCNGITGSVSADVYQEANNETSITYGVPVVSLSVSDIPASGGTVSSGTVTYTQTRVQNYTSGGTKGLSNVTSGGSISFSTAVSASSKGTTVSDRTKVGTLTATVTLNGQKGSGSADVYQAANTRYDKRTVLHFDNFEGPASKTVSAAGGQVNLSLELVRGFTSGAEGDSVDVTNDTLSSYSVSGTGFSISSSDKGLLLVANRGTTVGSERNGTVTGTWNGLTSPAIVCTQSANSATYGAVSISGGSVSVIPASGGTVSSMSGISASQTVSFSSGDSRPGSVSISYSSAVSASSKGINISNQTTAGTLTATATGEGSKTATKALTVYQAGNYVTAIKGSLGTFSYPTISAGATSATPDLSAGFGILFTFSSGSTSSSAPASTYGTLSVPSSFKLSASQNGFTAVNASTGVLTATNRGTTIGDARTSGTVTRTLTATWTPTSSYNTAGTKTSTWSTTATCTQAANTLTWNTPTISRTTPVTIAAAGGTDNVATGLTYSQTGQYSSGSPASANSGGTLSYAVKTAKTGFSLSGSTVTATNNTSTSARNGFVVTITLKLNDKTTTKDITYNQAAGYFTYANPVINATYPTIPASGGTVTPTVSYSQTYGWNGATSGAGTDTTGGSIGYAGSSVNTSNGSVTAGSKGAVASGVTDITTATITVTMHGKRSDKQVKVQQAANSIERYNYGNYTASLSLNNTAALAAGATTRTVTWGYIRRSKTPVYTSGDPGSASTETWSGTAYLTVSVNSGTSYCSVNPASYTNSSATTSSTLTKTTYGTTVVSAQTYTLQVRQGSASGTVVASTSVTSNANAVTNSNYNPRITTYGTPTVSIGSGMTAAGGSATVSHSVSNTQTYNALYTSGATGPNQTRSVTGTTTISITSNGNSAFSLSGNTLSHRDMATTLATDSVTITAKNSGDTSKTKTASTSITNSRQATGSSGGVTTYENVIVGTITNTTIPASGGSATATAGNGSQSWNKTAVVTTYTYDSRDTKQETTTAASSGKNTIAPSVSSITATASSKGRTISGQTTVKSQTVTWSGSGSKSASGTMYIYQAANSVKSYSNILINQFGYDNIPYSGGSDSPVMDITYDVTYDSGTYRDEHGIPSGYSISYTISGSGFSINASSGVVTAQANTTTNTRSATVTATVKNSSSTSVTSATTKITQDAKPGPVDIYITTSFNYATSQIQINFSSAPKDTFFIKFMGYDQFGGIWEYTTGIVPSSSTSFLFSPPGYSITDQFSIEGIGSSEYTISPSSPYETSNARYYWSSGMITMV